MPLAGAPDNVICPRCGSEGLHVCEDPPKPPIGWAEVELMGHRRLWGHLSEEEVAGARFLLLFVPEVEGRPAETHLYSTAAVYGIHPATEAAVIEALTPWKPPAECGATFGEAGHPPDTCTLPVGHDGAHEGLPF